jgi:hypothetical protein
VHGAFAESASWYDVIGCLQDQCYTAIAAANPIPSVAGDAQFVASILESIQGPHRPRCSTCVFGDLGGSTNSCAADTWKRRGFCRDASEPSIDETDAERTPDWDRLRTAAERNPGCIEILGPPPFEAAKEFTERPSASAARPDRYRPGL